LTTDALLGSVEHPIEVEVRLGRFTRSAGDSTRRRGVYVYLGYGFVSRTAITMIRMHS
jgi:hypothetical protein